MKKQIFYKGKLQSSLSWDSLTKTLIHISYTQAEEENIKTVITAPSFEEAKKWSTTKMENTEENPFMPTQPDTNLVEYRYALSFIQPKSRTYQHTMWVEAMFLLSLKIKEKYLPKQVKQLAKDSYFT